MKKMMTCAVCVVLALGCIAFGACAEANLDRFCDTWISDDYVLEITREGDDFKCNVMFEAGNGETEIWEYDLCWYDAEKDALESFTVSKQRGYVDSKTAEFVETDWSLSDMYYSTFALSDSGDELTWTDDGLDKPIVLKRL